MAQLDLFTPARAEHVPPVATVYLCGPFTIRTKRGVLLDEWVQARSVDEARARVIRECAEDGNEFVGG